MSPRCARWSPQASGAPGTPARSARRGGSVGSSADADGPRAPWRPAPLVPSRKAGALWTSAFAIPLGLSCARRPAATRNKISRSRSNRAVPSCGCGCLGPSTTPGEDRATPHVCRSGRETETGSVFVTAVMWCAATQCVRGWRSRPSGHQAHMSYVLWSRIRDHATPHHQIEDRRRHLWAPGPRRLATSVSYRPRPSTA